MISIVFTGGSIPEKRRLLKYINENTTIIAADSGLHAAIEYNLKLDFLVGDMDSVSPELIPSYLSDDKVIRHSCYKDETDTELAVSLAKKHGQKVILAGGGEGRLDHSLALYHMFSQENYPDIWLTEKEEIHVIKKLVRFNNMKGKTVSFFSPRKNVGKVTSEGLKWPLDELCWQDGHYSISNIVDAEELTVNVRNGFLLMVINNSGSI